MRRGTMPRGPGMTQSGSPAPRRSALIVAGPTASGKSALALALARRSRRRRHQRRFHAGLPRAARPDGAADAGGGSAGAAPPLRRAARRRRRRTWRGGASRPSRRWRRRAAAGRLPILCGGTGLYFLSLTEGPVRDSRRCRRWAREEARALLAALGAAGAACGLARVGPGHGGGAAARPTASASPAPSRCCSARGGAWPPGSEDGAHPGRAPWRFAAILLDPPRRGAARRHRRAVRRHAARTARWRR